MEDQANPKQPKHRGTTNLAFAAYAKMRGLKILQAADSRRGAVIEYDFTFEDADGQWDTLQFEFANSESARFDNAVRTLKQLCKIGGK